MCCIDLSYSGLVTLVQTALHVFALDQVVVPQLLAVSALLLLWVEHHLHPLCQLAARVFVTWVRISCRHIVSIHTDSRGFEGLTPGETCILDSLDHKAYRLGASGFST